MHWLRFRPRCTVSRMMIVVGIAGMALAIESMRRSSRDRALNAQGYRASADALSEYRKVGLQMIEWARSRGTADLETWARDIEKENEAYRKREQIYRELAGKYARAARYPWLPVSPDPPEPD